MIVTYYFIKYSKDMQEKMDDNNLILYLVGHYILFYDVLYVLFDEYNILLLNF